MDNMVDLKMKMIDIENKIVGVKQPIFIIAEAGINHNGKIELAKKLIDIAVKADVDAIKFQTAKAEDVVIKKIEMPDYAKKNNEKIITQLEMIKKYELKYKDFSMLKDYCDKRGIIFLSTPHSFDAIDFLDDLVSAYKFGSGDITNIPTLKYAAKKGKPIILGTGMATLQEVKDAVNAIKFEKNEQIIALHCTTNYPCPLEEVNLRAMITMQKELDCLIGYSDHTLNYIVPIMAIALGAVVIEKHFTIDRNLPGPDHLASLEPNELKNMVLKIRKAEKILGSYDKKPTDSEKKIMNFVRKSIIAKKDIKKGSTVDKDMLIIKRPGNGLLPAEIGKLLGKKTKRYISKDEIFQLNMVE
jgi:N-acetylneuraminate synthase/N,N'-diacetyllegionaminate synthase